MRWNKRYDGTKASLGNKSHKPHSPHPNAHTKEEITWIENYHLRNPNISICELFGKLVSEKDYQRYPGSLYRVFIRLGYRKQPVSTKEKRRNLKPYDTPKGMGVKWQMDVKYVPKRCYSGKKRQQFYQYTMIDEATRERFIYAYLEQSSYSTIGFVKRAIKYFGYVPQIIQTDNGAEFTHFVKTNRVHPLDVLCKALKIEHKLIHPRTHRERSHRNDQERFYNYTEILLVRRFTKTNGSLSKTLKQYPNECT